VANHNFKVKKGLEVGTGVTITDGGITAIGIVTALQFSGDGSGLTGVVSASDSGVVIQEEGSSVGTASTINFIGGNVTAALNGGIASVTIGGGDMVTDTTPQLGGNLDLNGKNITGIGSISITGSISATGVSTFSENVVFQSTASFGDNDKINLGAGNDLQIYHDGSHSRIKDSGTGSLISQASRFSVHSADDSEVMIDASQNSYVKLYHDNVLRLETTNAGLTITGTASATTFSGSGASLTTLNASELDSGTVPDARFPATLPAASGIALTSLNASNLGIGTIPDARFPATLPTASGANLTNIPAGQLTGTVADARLSTVSSSKLSGALPALDGSALTDLTGVPAGTYGASALTPIITVDSDGRITGITTVVTSGTGAGAFNNVIEDTTPQLGGNLDLNTKTINGTGNIDITGYAAVSGVSTFSGSVGFATHIHDAGTGGLDIRTNLLRIKNDADSETLATFAENGAVSFYHDNTLKFNTTSTGAVVTGSLTATTIVKSGGSSSQFLKADGSVDTSTYLTSFTETDPIVGAINGIVKANGSGTISAAVAGTDYLTPTGDGSGLTNLPSAGVSTSSTNIQATWLVTSNGSSAYRFAGPGNDAADNNPDLYLVRGQRYRFTNNSGGSHPFQIRVASGGSAYSTGVTNNGGASGNIDFNVQWDAPAKLFYQCTSHGAMVGNIYIVGGPQVISGIVTATGFSGSGASLTGVNATTLDSIDSGSFLRSDADDTYAGNLTFNGFIAPTGTNVARNLRLRGGTTASTDVGISLYNGSNQWTCQLYGHYNASTPSYGFLTSNWGGWDLRKYVDGQLQIRVGGSDYNVWHAGNDGSGTGLDADTVDGIQASSFLRSDADDVGTGKIILGATISSGSSAKLQVGGFMRTGAIMLAVGNSGATSFNTTNERWIMNNGSHIYASTSSTSYNNKIWTDSNDGSGSGLDADTLDGVEGSKFFASYNNGSGGWEDSNRNFLVRSGGTSMGLCMEQSNGTFGFQLYASGSTYGFLNANWGGWDIQKTVNGQLKVTVSGSSYTVWHNGNDGSGSGLDADTVDGIQGASLLRSDADDTMSANLTVDNGTSTLVNVKCDNGGNAIVRAGGDGQGTGVFEVSQDNGSHGGGMSYNGDGSPTFVSGETSDHVTFYRIQSGTRSEVFHYAYSSANVLFNADITASGNVTAYSDITLKTNVKPIDNALDKVQQIQGITYNRVDLDDNPRHAGVIAQEVEKVLPEVVQTDEKGIKSVAYGNMVGLLVEAIKDQQKQIDELRAKLEEK